MERVLRGIAGAFILISLGMARFVDYRWLYFTVFIGLNLLQSAFSDWCPMMAVLGRVGLKKHKECCGEKKVS